jgi:hypothetical protein
MTKSDSQPLKLVCGRNLIKLGEVSKRDPGMLDADLKG